MDMSIFHSVRGKKALSNLNGHEWEQALGDSDGQGSLACCSPWGLKESDTTECEQQQPLALSWNLQSSPQS